MLYKINGVVSCVESGFLREQTEKKPNPTHETAPLFLYNPVKTATHSFKLTISIMEQIEKHTV